jgi:hypothetical protein
MAAKGGVLGEGNMTEGEEFLGIDGMRHGITPPP